MNKIYSIEIPSLNPLYLRFDNIPYDSAKKFIESNKNHRYCRLYDNGEWVAKNNHRRNNELFDLGYRIVLYVSEMPEEFKGFLTRFEKENNCS